MSRPIPVEIIPSHVYLSEADQQTLFGIGHAMTIREPHTQPGQVVYEDTVQVFGRGDKQLTLRVLGPHWDHSHVEITPTEAWFLGYEMEETKTGDTSKGMYGRLVGPHGEIELEHGLIIPRPHMTCSAKDAEMLHVKNGEEVDIEISGPRKHILENILVRVHPMFKTRIEIHQDHARDAWITRLTHGVLKK